MSPINLRTRLARLARVARLRGEEAGQTLIEYGGMLLLISITVIVLLAALGLDLAETFNEVEDALGLGNDNTVDPAMTGQDDQTTPTATGDVIP